MNFDEIEDFLKNTQSKLSEFQSLDFLYGLYIELTVIKSELHKLIHFCVEDYERKEYFAAIDFASSLQVVVNAKIRESIKMKFENLKYDFEIEKKYLENELEKQSNQAILFQEFAKQMLSKKQFSKINILTAHCSELNMKMKDYMMKRMFESLDLEEDEL